jgi:hypothetical protein
MRIDPDCRDPEILAAEVRRLNAVIAAGEQTLTDAEREAIERAAFALGGGEDWSVEGGTKDKQACVTLRNLLERMK